MSVRNEMELLVGDELARVKAARGPEHEGCWCLLCETDIVALALTMLPPLYCREATADHAAGVIRPGTIRDAVQSALNRVGLRPKHRAGTRPTSREQIALVNFTFEVGTTMVGPALGRSGMACSCQTCRSDTLAYALNRYPAKYGVAKGGMRSLHRTYIEFMRYELGLLIHQAARIISSRPHNSYGR